MCFTPSSKYGLSPNFATRDITCYKIMSPTKKPNVFSSPHRSTTYVCEKGKVFHAKTAWYDERAGKYRYKRINGLVSRLGGEALGEVHEGLHSYRTRAQARFHTKENGYDYTILRFVIPAGTQYMGNRLEYVSLRLKFVSVVRRSKSISI
jgi:hypothetical protein